VKTTRRYVDTSNTYLSIDATSMIRGISKEKPSLLFDLCIDIIWSAYEVIGDSTRLCERCQLDIISQMQQGLAGTHKSGANQSTSTDRNPNMEAGILSSRGLDLKDDIAIAIVCVELRA
jgi:hypothetical protein